MKQLVPALFGVGAVMALTGAAVFITGWIYAPYIYTIGAGFIALAQVNTPVKGKSKTLKRLRVQQIFGALALILTGAFMFTTLPASLLLPYSNSTPPSVFHRKKKRKGHKKTCPKLHSLEQEHYNLHISNINNEISFIREKLKKVTY